MLFRRVNIIVVRQYRAFAGGPVGKEAQPPSYQQMMFISCLLHSIKAYIHNMYLTSTLGHEASKNAE